MTGKTHQYFIVTASVLPPLVMLGAIVLLWDRYVTPTDVGILVVSYTLSALGVSAGFHRLLAHRAYKVGKPIRLALAALGTMAAEGPPIVWCSHHRRHHSLSDQEGDPHSPRIGVEPGLRGALKGLWHAHMGWLFHTELTSDPMKYAPDLVREPEMRWMSLHFLELVGLGLLLPGVAGLLISHSLVGGLTGMIWGGFVRMFLIHHATYAVNSVGHFAGEHRFDSRDFSVNVAWLALPSFGEAWHNNHHAFPTSYRHGLRWWEVDLSALFIAGLERLGLAWDVVKVSPERQRTREVAGELRR